MHPAVLEHDPDSLAPVAVRRGGIGAQHADLAAAARPVALQDLHRGRLSGAVRPQEGEDLGARDLEVDAANRLQLAVGLAQATHADHWLGHQDWIEWTAPRGPGCLRPTRSAR